MNCHETYDLHFIFFSLRWPIFVEAVVMSTSFGSFKGYLSVSKQTTVMNAVSENSFKWQITTKDNASNSQGMLLSFTKISTNGCHFQFFSQMTSPPILTHTHTFCMCTHPCVCVYMYMYVYVMGVCGQLANTLDDRSSQGFTPLAPRQENVFLFFSVNNWADSSAGAMETQRTYKSWTVSCAFASRQKVHFTSFMWSLPVRTVISIMPPFIFREGSDRNCQNPSP